MKEELFTSDAMTARDLHERVRYIDLPCGMIECEY